MTGFSPFKDPSETVPYRYDVPWDQDSAWPESCQILFARHRFGRDERLIDQLSSELKIKFDREAQRQAQRNGHLYSAEMESVTKTSRAVAMIVVMQRDSQGLHWPPWMKQTLADHRVVADPRAGKPIEGPLPQEWVEMLDPLVLEHVELFLSDLYDPRSRGDLENFRKGREGLAGSPEHGASIDGGGGDAVGDAVAPYR